MTSRLALALCALGIGCATQAAGPAPARPAPKPITVPPPPSPPPPSGGTVDIDSPLFKDVPGGNFALTGGSFAKVQGQFQAIFASVMGTFMTSLGARGWKQWLRCFEGSGEFRAANGYAYVAGRIELRTAHGGVTLSDVIRCAHEAGFETRLDHDGKYVVVDTSMNGRPYSFSYLALPDHAIYGKVWVVPGVISPPATRAELEADQAASAGASAANDLDLLALARQVDRRAVWFVGSGKGTPLADKLGEVYGTADLAHGMHIVVVVQLVDDALRERLTSMYREARKHEARLSAVARAVLDRSDLRESGGRLHFVLDYSEEDMAAAEKLVAEGATVDVRASIIEMGEFKDRMCACRDRPCAQAVSHDVLAWTKRARPPDRPMTDGEKQQVSEITKQMTDCLTRATSASPP